jgi:hypothetical protein
MLILTTTSDVIRCGHSSTNAVDYAVSYVDNTTAAYTPGRQVAVVSGTGPTTVLGSPAASTQRQCKHFQACTRGGPNTITVEVFDGATAYRQLAITLLSGETLEYEDAAGWFVKDAAGQVKNVTNLQLTLTGDVTGSGSGTITTTLANIPNDTPAAGDILFTEIAAPATPAAGKGRVYVDSTSHNLALKNSAGTVNHGIITRAAVAHFWINSVADDGSSTAAQPAFTDISGTATQAQLPDVVVGVQTFTAGGTYTAAAGVRSQIVEGYAAGGGGGGTTSVAASAAAGGGGGSGGYFRRRYTIAAASTGTVVIGTAGTAGVATGGNGGTGGNTTFTDGTTLCTANGGLGGLGMTGGNLKCAEGGAGGAVSTNGDLNASGSPGAPALTLAATQASSGAGGSCLAGGGGVGVAAQGAGVAGAGHGSGGSGGCTINAGAAVTGGAGTGGLVIITEYA